MQPLAWGDAANANVSAAQNLLPDQRHHDGMINIVVRRVAVCDILKREPADEADDTGIARLQDPIGPLLHDLKLANKGFDDNLCGVEHRASPEADRTEKTHTEGQQRPRGRRAAKQRDELAALHSITSSARC